MHKETETSSRMHTTQLIRFFLNYTFGIQQGGMKQCFKQVNLPYIKTL
jgi:hypothetical protein